MRYIIFSRVSTGIQTTENQIRECREYVNKHRQDGDEILEFDEEAKSTRLEMKDRPILQAMLNAIRKGDVLVIYKLSRLARGHELAMIYHQLMKKGVKLVSLYEVQIDDMLIHAYAMVGAAERRNIQQATISGFNRKRANSEKIGAISFGYKMDHTRIQQKEKLRSTGKPYIMIPDEVESSAVEIMITLRSRGFPYEAIANQLASKGYKNRVGNPIHKMTIFRVLKRLGKQNQAPKAQETG